jgi:hypothetical protein
MPSDIMEKLRAEGLLPEEGDGGRETPVASMRPNSSLTRRTPEPAPPPVEDGAPVPQLFSQAPPPPHPADEERVSTKITAPPPALTAPESVETPIAFASPPVLTPTAEVSEEKDITALTRQPKGPSKTTMYLVAAVVVVLLIVALLRLRG